MVKTLRIRGSKYLLKEKLSKRETFHAHELSQKVDRLVSFLPDSPEAWRRIRCWRRLDTESSVLPNLISTTLHDGRVVTVSHWIQGQTLKSYLNRKRNREDWPALYESVRLFRGLVHGLSRLHGRRIVHGDISPANMILRGPNPTRLSLIDCGSIWSPESLVRLEGDGYSPLYAAPELSWQSSPHPDALAKRLGEPSYLSDQFSASVVLYELLTGKLPFAGLGGKIGEASEGSIPKYKTASAHFVDARYYPRSVVRSVDALVSRGLAISPDERFVSKGSWRDAVDSAWEELQRPLRAKSSGQGLFDKPVLGAFIRWLASFHKE